MESISLIGYANARNRRLRFGIKYQDRISHIYTIGRTGVGKTTLLQTLALQDILEGRGLCVIDPHSDIAERLFKSTYPIPISPIDTTR